MPGYPSPPARDVFPTPEKNRRTFVKICDVSNNVNTVATPLPHGSVFAAMTTLVPTPPTQPGTVTVESTQSQPTPSDSEQMEAEVEPMCSPPPEIPPQPIAPQPISSEMVHYESNCLKLEISPKVFIEGFCPASIAKEVELSKDRFKSFYQRQLASTVS